MKRSQRAKVGKWNHAGGNLGKMEIVVSESCCCCCCCCCLSSKAFVSGPLQSTMASGSMGGEDSHLYHPASVNLRSSYADASKYTNTKVKFRYLYIANWCEGQKWCPVVTWCQHTDTNCHFSWRLIKLGARDSRG